MRALMPQNPHRKCLVGITKQRGISAKMQTMASSENRFLSIRAWCAQMAANIRSNNYMDLHGIITSFTTTIIQCQAFLFSFFGMITVNRMTNAMELWRTRHSEYEMTSSKIIWVCSILKKQAEIEQRFQLLYPRDRAYPDTRLILTVTKSTEWCHHTISRSIASTWRNLSIDHQGTQRLLAYGHADVRKSLLAQSLFCLWICSIYILYFGTQNKQTCHRICHCATRGQDSKRVSRSNKCGVPGCHTFAAGRSKWRASTAGAASVQLYMVYVQVADSDPK